MIVGDLDLEESYLSGTRDSRLGSHETEDTYWSCWSFPLRTSQCASNRCCGIHFLLCLSASQSPRFLRIHLILLLQPAPLRHRLKRGLPAIQLALLDAHRLLAWPATLELLRHADRRVAAEALPHVDHPALALPEATLQLLALHRQLIDEGRGQAFDGCVFGDHYAVAILEAGG